MLQNMHDKELEDAFVKQNMQELDDKMCEKSVLPRIIKEDHDEKLNNRDLFKRDEDCECDH